MNELPSGFLERMQRLLSEEEYHDFLESYNKEPEKGIRINPLKATKEEVLKKLPEDFKAHDIKWCPTGLYIDSQSRPGKQPGYYTGFYYPQEPSAMIPAEALEVEPGDVVLDLCAAPGGKSTQLAGKMKGQGTLVLNEIVGKRVNVLAQNVERMGVRNSVILNESPQKLSENLPGFFNKILIDAPCSGEGMFRKDVKVREEWDENKPGSCSVLQKQIVEYADVLLKPGGELVYSTCTFSPEENEQVVEFLLDTNRYELMPIPIEGITTTGRSEYSQKQLEEVNKAIRVWPHHSNGEGHFIARFKKLDSVDEPKRWKRRKRSRKGAPEKQLRRANRKRIGDFYTFQKKYMPDFDTENLYIQGNRLYKLPENINENILENLKVYTPGLFLGELKKNRFEPSHTLAMALKKNEFANTYEMDQEELWSYLKGEEIRPKGLVDSGWTLMCYDQSPVGFGKMSTTIKNKYPKGLRIYKK